MKLIPLFILVLTAPPAFGQSLAEVARAEAARREAISHAVPVYTNATLITLPMPTASIPPAGVQQAQFRGNAIYVRYVERQLAPAPVPGPRFFVFGSPTSGPFGEFKPFDPPRRLDGTLLSDPPWHVSTYLGHHGWQTLRSGAQPSVTTRSDRSGDRRRYDQQR